MTRPARKTPRTTSRTRCLLLPGAPALHCPGAPALHCPGAPALHCPGAPALLLLAGTPALLLAGTLALFGLAACGDSPAEVTDEIVVPAADSSAIDTRAGALAEAREQRSTRARAGVDALLSAPGPATLLAALAQGHADARALLGPHNLRYKATFVLTPETPTRPVVDQPIQQDQRIVDDLVLAWGSQPGEPVRLHLSQQTDKGEGREVIILDEQVYTRLAHRGWHTRPLDSELHWVWLDEAQHCVHDLVELAAPALAVTAQEVGDAVEVTLQLAPAVDPARVAAGYGREWRQRTEIAEVSGTITLDRNSGLWRSAEVTVRHVVRDALDRPQRGETQLTATASPAELVTIEAPQVTSPVPERIRPELERQRLLGGLAGLAGS